MNIETLKQDMTLEARRIGEIAALRRKVRNLESMVRVLEDAYNMAARFSQIKTLDEYPEYVELKQLVKNERNNYAN